MSDHDERWMQLALNEARAAAEAGEVPVGAVVVKDGVLLATGRNAPVALHDPSAHAEINAMRAAAAQLGNYRLEGCELFVTLEPCAMCAGAMLHARLARVVYGAADPKTGAAGSVVDLFAQPLLNHRTRVAGGLLARASAALLQTFFKTRRSQARERAEPLRDDALRTPEARFEALPDAPWAPHFVADLPALHGWRMHYVDEGGHSDRGCCLCLHGPGQWSYVWRHLIARLRQAGAPHVLAPDLIGFGKSDKPKREAVHQLEWHQQVLLEWITRLDLRHIVLVLSHEALEPGTSLIEAAPERFAGMLVAELAGQSTGNAAWRAPFPDAGFEAALRVWGRGHGCDLPPRQARALANVAMGYFAP
jgi:tRNA(adenine34) deaminase